MLYLFFLSALLLSTTAFAVPSYHSKFDLLRSFTTPTPSTSDLSTTAAPAKCGIDSYDFSTLMKSDWAGLADDYSELYYINLCHTVQNLWCTLNPDTAAVQVCQVSPSDTQYTYKLMSNDTSAMQWSYINGADAKDGVQFKSQTGDGGGGCPHGGRRITVGRLVCGNSTGVISGVMEGPACTYTMTLPNTMVCQAGQAMDVYTEQVERVQRAIQRATQNQ